VKGEPVEWRTAVAIAAEMLRAHSSDKIGVIASARATNEELFLLRRLIKTLGVEKQHDVIPRNGEPDGLLVSADRNPNTTGAKLLGITGSRVGNRLKKIADGVRSGAIKALICFGEDATKAGLTEADLRRLDALVVMDILPNRTTPLATVLLPSSAWCEKRGSMINVKGRLQRLNRALNAPGLARDDWEILRDLIQAISGSNGLYMIEDVFKQMASEVKEFAGLSLSKIGDLGLPLINMDEKKDEEAAKS
jgi:NADH-quinone oxidoreductase subunit G